jgi:hypothetical protein
MLRSILFRPNAKESLPLEEDILFPALSKQVNLQFACMTLILQCIYFGKRHVIVIFFKIL